MNRGSEWNRTTSFNTTTGLQPGTLPVSHTPQTMETSDDPSTDHNEKSPPRCFLRRAPNALAGNSLRVWIPLRFRLVMLIALPGAIAGEATPGSGLACRVTHDLPHLPGAHGRGGADGRSGAKAGSGYGSREHHDEDDTTRAMVIRQAQRCLRS